jgi:hypothetical protein
MHGVRDFMSNILRLLLVGSLAGLAGCTSVQQADRVQLPGEMARTGLQVPPDVGERPIQTATAVPAR